jgi:hypothetical protein
MLDGPAWVIHAASRLSSPEGAAIEAEDIIETAPSTTLLRLEFEDGTLVDVGPSSASKRQATVRALTGMLAITDDPETKQVLGAMAMMNMEGEGIAEVREYFRRKLIKMGVVKPTEDELNELMQELQNQPPDPNSEYLKAAADEATSNAVKARADTVLTVAKAEETKAKTAETLSNIDIAQRDHLLGMVQTLGEQALPGGEMPSPAPAA